MAVSAAGARWRGAFGCAWPCQAVKLGRGTSFIAEGRCEGSVTGRFRGANFPRKQGADGPFRPDFRAVIETHDGAVIMVEWHGHGRSYPPERRQVVGSVFHLADREPYRRLNDAVCVCTGEVRAPADPGQPGPVLVIDVAELIWEPIAD
jgi:hypothetical protein